MGLKYSTERTLVPSENELPSESSQAVPLDLYFVRDVVCRLGEYDLEQKIDLEIKMREGTTKLLAACKHPSQSLEAAKSLLTSNERMNAYMSELQKRKAIEKKGVEFLKLNSRREVSKAKVSISEIRMPLIWKDTDHFKNKGDYRRFAVFCLLRIGTEIYDTVLLHSVDRSMTDISFDDVAVFHHIPPDFEFKLEVYSKVLHDDLSIASTPRKLKKKISSSVSRTFGRKVAASLKDEFSENGPKFELIAEATLKLKDASDMIKTHDLLMNSENGQSALPLFGHFCCRLAVSPDCISEERLSGFLKTTVNLKPSENTPSKLEVSKKNGSNTTTINTSNTTTTNNNNQCNKPEEVSIVWASLKHFKLFLWKTEHKGTESIRRVSHIPETPNLVVPISKSMTVKRQNSLTFTLKPDGSNEKDSYSFTVLNKDDLSLWIEKIEQHIRDFIAWEVAAENPMEIPSPSPNRAPMFFRPRVPGSLYDEIPLLDSPSKMKTSNSSLGISPSFSLRSRSSSISSSSGTGGSTCTTNSIEQQQPHHQNNQIPVSHQKRRLGGGGTIGGLSRSFLLSTPSSTLTKSATNYALY